MTELSDEGATHEAAISMEPFPRNPNPEPMPDPDDQDVFCTRFDSYIGMWYKQGAYFPEYGPKYGGGLGTYNAKHRPLAVYAPEVNKTFFCWGGTTKGNHLRDRYVDNQPGNLLHMVSYYDHETGRVPKPVIVFDKWCGDPHDNPVLQIDAGGTLWLFSPSHGHGTTRSFIHRSVEPYAIDRWETVYNGSRYAYPQPWYDLDHGFLLMHTRYEGGRVLYAVTSPDGLAWSEGQKLAHIAQGHYQVTAYDSEHRIVATAFNYHPEKGGLEARTNLYYAQTTDWGRTWTNILGEPLDLPLTEVRNPALIWETEDAGLNVYMKDLVFDAAGRPIVICVTSEGYEPGPENNPRIWRFARWAGAGWRITRGPTSDNNYDMGFLSIEKDRWALIAPTEPGPQPYNPGGEIAMWQSDDLGSSWRKVKQLTYDSPRNHTYVRRSLNAHPAFHAFWADGDARRPSASFLYFTDREGETVRRLPVEMSRAFQEPEVCE